MVGNLVQVISVLVGDALQPRKIALEAGIVPVSLQLGKNATDRKEKGEDLPSWVPYVVKILDSLAQLQLPATKDDTSDVSPLLSVDQQKEALELCTRLLKSDPQLDALKSTLLLCSRLTRNYDFATLFVQEKGVELLLALTGEQTNGLITTVLRHLLEDPDTLQAAMEREITSTINSTSGAKTTVKTLLTTMSPVVYRDAEIFLKAAGNTLRFPPGNR